MKKVKKIDPDEPYFCGMTPQEMWDIFKVAAARHYDWSTYEPKHVTFGIYEHQNETYLQLCAPFKNKSGEYERHTGFLAKFYPDGFFSYENGFDVQLRYSEPIKVYQMIEAAMRKQKPD